MKPGAPRSFGAQLKALRETAGYTQEELATIAGLSVHAVSALERGERRRPHVETVRTLSAALDLAGPSRDAFLASARAAVHTTASDELSRESLPLPLTVLIGRDADVETLRQWFAEPASRLITLVGPGGVGKTRLALELARAIAEEGSVRMRFVPLAALRDPGFVGPAIAEALGLTDVTALDLPRRARAAWADHHTLLVLDNFEHMLAAAPLVAELLGQIARDGPEQVVVLEPVEQIVEGEHLDPGGREFERQGQSIKPPTNRRHCPTVRRREAKVAVHVAHPFHEETHGWNAGQIGRRHRLRRSRQREGTD